MGFFSDPAAKQVPVDFLPEPTSTPQPTTRRRSTDERKQRRKDRSSHHRRRCSDSFIPDLDTNTSIEMDMALLQEVFPTKTTSTTTSTPMRRSSSIKDLATGRRRGSSKNNGLGLDLSWHGSLHDSSTNTAASGSMQEHLEDLETFVRCVKNADKKKQEKILRRASRVDLDGII